MISVEIINKAVDIVSENVEVKIHDFVTGEKEFSGYLLGEDFKLLSEEEKETMLFIHLVLFFCLSANEASKFDPEKFQEIEDANWKHFNEQGRTWEEKKEKIFQGYDEEELLAFVEDMLNGDEISSLSQELIFITAKSYIDTKKL